MLDALRQLAKQWFYGFPTSTQHHANRQFKRVRLKRRKLRAKLRRRRSISKHFLLHKSHAEFDRRYKQLRKDGIPGYSTFGFPMEVK